MTCLKIKTFKRKAYYRKKGENMQEAWRTPMRSPQLLAKGKSKAAEEFSQSTALQYSYDLDWSFIRQQPPDREWSIDDQSYTPPLKPQDCGDKRSPHSETVPLSTQNTYSPHRTRK